MNKIKNLYIKSSEYIDVGLFMQTTENSIIQNCVLENVIADKLVFIHEGKTLIGTQDFPIIIPKEKVIL